MGVLVLKNWQFYLLLVLAILGAASLVPVFKITLQEVSAEQITFFNYFIPAVFFLIVLSARKELALIKEYRPKIPHFLFLAFFGLFFNRIFYLNSFHLIQAVEANIMYYTYPLSVAILGFLFLKEKISRANMLGLAISFIGVLVVITKLDFSFLSMNLFGDLLAVLAGTSYAIYLVFSKKFRFNAMVLLFYSCLFASIITALYTLAFSGFTSPSLVGWAGLIYLGLAEGILLFLFIELLRRRNTFRVANSFYAIPFVVVVLNHFILNEVIYSSYIIGLVLLVLGILIQHRGKLAKVRVQAEIL